MNEFKINLKKETFFINEGNSVIGDICFSFGDWYFPEKDWDDFVVLLIAWLSGEIIKLKFNNKEPICMRFMEGCFKVSLILDAQQQCTIQFIEGEKLAGDDEIIHKTVTVPFENVKSEVKKACKILLTMKETKKLDFEEDYEKLKESYDILCKC